MSSEKHRFITNKMAAKAIQIQVPRAKRSKRVRAANKFLSNISLDGSVVKDRNKKETMKSKTKLKPTLDKEEEDILSNPNFANSAVQRRPKLLASFSTTNAIEDEDNLDLAGLAFSATTFYVDNSVERSRGRTTSFRDSKLWQSNLTCTSSRNFVKYREYLVGKRIVICSGHSIPFAVYSTLQYSQQDKGESLDKNPHRLRRISGEHGCDFYGIKGVDIGAQNKSVSYAHLLVPTSCLSTSPRTFLSPRKNMGTTPVQTLQEPRSSCKSSVSSNFEIVGSSSGEILPSSRGDNFVSSHGEQTSIFDNYDPLLLDDPELRSGRHRKVLQLSSFMVSIIEYAKPSQLKKDLNEQFKEKFPNMEITLSKLRSLKHDLVKLSTEEKVNKMNRKLVAGSCLLLAAKFNNDLKKGSVKQLINSICDWFRVSTKDLFLFEIQALVALEFNLHLPSSQLIPHLKRLESGTASFI